ncbi:hypothetical protein F0562_000624 [Nyssa sinensis]|uniref:Uncharacterized protein n=1 Tax=Nyssa sinensis TaxID=561372 RepID=A0A5J5C484_9ASTE|nr:hypothetical protein F0562_000624 [Nyssa sinensis]
MRIRYELTGQLPSPIAVWQAELCHRVHPRRALAKLQAAAHSLAMARAHCATGSFLLPFANTTPIRRKPLVLLSSSISTPSPSKLTKRKNHLRLKLLKTLTKPYPIPLNLEEVLTNPIIPVESPHEQQTESPSDQLPHDSCPGVAVEVPKEFPSNEIQLSEISDAAGVLEGSVSNFSTRSVIKFGLFFVGAFVFQTICAVWILGSAHSDHNNENLGSEDKTRGLELEMNQTNKAKLNFLVNGSDNSFHGKLGFKQGGIVHMDESELENKIAEIRQMARDARESERLETKANGLDDNDDVKTGIEKEVDSRMVKLRKKLENTGDKSPVSSVSYLRKDDKFENSVKKDGLEAKEANGPLMFKEKHKFRSPLNNPSNKPKGFRGSTDHSVTKIKNSEKQMTGNESVGDGLDSLDKEHQLDLPNAKLQGNISMVLEEDAGKTQSIEASKSSQTPQKKLGLGKERGKTKLGKKMGPDRSEPRTGILQESGSGRPLVEDVESTKSSQLVSLNSQSPAKENQDTTTISNKLDVSSRNDSLKGREVGRKQATNLARDNKSDTKTDLWWLSLPYVLAILMRRGHEGEGPRGLFTLKINSHAKDDHDSSHTVAFEDRGDATNFCYLLQSFFEDLGDFNADIVPLSTKELDEEVKSNAMKVIVVRKGQLQLYAGQPLTDVEMALLSLVKQS